MSKDFKKIFKWLSISLGIFVFVAVSYLVIAVVFIGHAALSDNGARVAVEKSYNTLTLPTAMHLSNKIQIGDPVDSPGELGWEYIYTYVGSSDSIWNLLKRGLQSESFSIQDSSIPGGDAENTSLNLRLQISLDAGRMTIDATRINE